MKLPIGHQELFENFKKGLNQALRFVVNVVDLSFFGTIFKPIFILKSSGHNGITYI